MSPTQGCFVGMNDYFSFTYSLLQTSSTHSLWQSSSTHSLWQSSSTHSLWQSSSTHSLWQSSSTHTLWQSSSTHSLWQSSATHSLTASAVVGPHGALHLSSVLFTNNSWVSEASPTLASESMRIFWSDFNN